MRRWKIPLLTAATLLLALSGTVQASHGGPEHHASGRGEREVEQVQRTCLLFVVFEQDLICVDESVVTTTTSERFDFDARIGRRHADAHGRITYSVETTTTQRIEHTQRGRDEFCGTVLVCLPEGEFVPPTHSGATMRADVTCLTVVQNRATIGGHVTRFSGDLQPRRGILLDVTDNTIARQQLTEDEFLAAITNDVPECPPPALSKPPITDGDIYVDQS